MRVENLKKQESVVESVLFTMGQSVEIRQLAAALESDEETAIQAVERLKEKYDKRKAGMQIVRLDDSYQMCSRVDYYENLTRRYRREESIEMIYKIRKMREEKMPIPEIKGKIKG